MGEIPLKCLVYLAGVRNVSLMVHCIIKTKRLRSQCFIQTILVNFSLFCGFGCYIYALLCVPGASGGQQRNTGLAGTGVPYSFESTCGSWESNHYLLEEQP